MNPDELLDRAARSLRDQTQDSVRSGDETLAQVLASLRIGRRRRRMLMVALVPLGTLFFGLAGWATVTSRWSTFLPSGLGPRSEVVPHKEVVRRGRRQPAIVPAEAGSVGDVAPLAQPDAFSTPEQSVSQPVPHTASPAATEASAVGRPAPRLASAAPIAAPASAPAAAAPTVNEPAAVDDELYRLAHEAHFVRRDYTAAMIAWNRYVMLGPKARFFVEARYNRAIALVRLGRRAEAVEALRPFAVSPPGSYRRAQARDLLRYLGVPAATVP